MDPKPIIEPIPYLSNTNLKVDCLRLDQIHPIVSGNKWYKLRYYLKAAKETNANAIASFGGPYSNHLVALSYAAKTEGLTSIGYVRSNQGEPITPSLQEAMNYGMQLVFLGRTSFQEKKDALLKENESSLNKDIYFVDEGGYGNIGAKGAATIIKDWKHNNANDVANAISNNVENPLHQYDFIICAVGTGTMIAGIINAAAQHQTIIGIPVLKNEGSIVNEIKNLLLNQNAAFTLLHEYHQGGYAKTTPVQINFMNQFWEETKIPTDIVYTGKVFYAVNELVNKNYFKSNSSILVMHSGGLQGNRSLEKGILHFDY